MSLTVYPCHDQNIGFKRTAGCDEEEKRNPNSEFSSEGLVLKSLGLFSIESLFRQYVIKLVSSSHFDNFILAAIAINSIAIACVDYRFIDGNYQPSSDDSVRNNIVEKLEGFFTLFFTAECFLKVIAKGFMKGKYAYIRDGWNTLDFAIVVISILGLLPGAPNLSVLRSFRALRPLRSVSKLPSLRKIIRAFFDSIGNLANVMVLLVFLLICFALFGVTFWRGMYHFRCRITPFPVRLPISCRNVTDPCWDKFLLSAVNKPEEHRCLPFPNDDTSLWTKSTSPWFKMGPQDCVWPTDNSDLRVCSNNGHGLHSCVRPTIFDDKEILRTCGSNYDAFGNARFVNSIEPYGVPRMHADVFQEELNWGFTSFDSFALAFITTFQIVTLEGWSDIMYRTIDAWFVGPTILVFSLLIVLGGQIVMNIVLAVISGSLEKMEENQKFEGNPHETTSPNTTESTKRPATRMKIREYVETKSYSYLIHFTIFANTVILSMDHFGISPKLEMILDWGNFAITLIFFVDMVLCNISYGFWNYWSTSWTCFDGFIVVFSLIELAFTSIAGSNDNGKSVVSIFRSLRLIRLFKMARQWKSLHSLLDTINRAASDVQSFGVLLILFVFIYALVGMQLFSNRLHFDEVTGVHIDIADPKYTSAVIPRSNFDDFFWSVTTVFQVLTGENWNEVMFDCWRATSWVSPFYFVSLCIFGVFIVLNLFLAILLKRFEDGDVFMPDNQVYPEDGSLEAPKKTLVHHSINEFRLIINKFFLKRIGSKFCEEHFTRRLNDLNKRSARIVENKSFDSGVTFVIIASSVMLALDSPLSDPSTYFASILRILDIIFTIVFICEFLTKLAALGAWKYFQDAWNVLDFAAVSASVLDLFDVKGGKSLRVIRALRVLRPLKMIKRFPEIKLVVDALLLSIPSVVNVAVVCAVFYLTFSIIGVTFLKGTFYKCLEDSLSPDQLNLVTYPKNVGSLNAKELSWLNTDLIGCNANTWNEETVPTSKDFCDCLENGKWIRTIPQNFDNALSGFALLFEISTTEGWVDVMHAAIDQRGMSMQPLQDNNRLWAIFFILFLVLGAFFVLELFVGVIIENFARIRDAKGQGLMTDSQKQWASTQAFVMKIKPEIKIRPKGKIQAYCYDLIMPVSNPWFDRFIVAVIIANCITISAKSFFDSDVKSSVLDVLNEAFSSIFVFEAVLKIIALGGRYFRETWNRFDFAIVCGLIIGFFLNKLTSGEYFASSISSMVSLIRIGRLIRLIRLVKQLRAPLNTIISVIPGMINIGALLLLVFFVYAICGVQLFGTISFQGDLNEQANFRTVGNAMVLLLRFATGENWNGFMWSLYERDTCNPIIEYNTTSPWCLSEEDYPDCTEVNGCGAGFTVFIFFYSFTLIVTFVLLNLFVGIVLEAFQCAQEGDILQLSDLEEFSSVWAEFDPYATGYMDASHFQLFLAKLQPPLGVGNFSQGDMLMKHQSLLEIRVNKKKEVNIVDVARQLAKRVTEEVQGEEFMELSDNHPLQLRVAMQEEGGMTLADINRARATLKAVIRLYKGKRRKNSLSPDANA